MQLTQPKQGDMVSAALKGFFALMEAWGLSQQDGMRLLGVQARSTYQHYKKSGAAQLSDDTLDRISYLLGIHKALRILFSRAPASVHEWMTTPNDHPLFAGRSPLEFILSGKMKDLYLVRSHLDAERGGW